MPGEDDSGNQPPRSVQDRADAIEPVSLFQNYGLAWIAAALLLVVGLLGWGLWGVEKANGDDSPTVVELSAAVEDGPRNGVVTGVYKDEICFTMKSYHKGGRNDDHTSCAPNGMVKNLGKEYSEGAVFAPRIDPVEGFVLSVTAFEVVGSDSGLLLHLPVEQDDPVPTPTATATTKSTTSATVLPNSGSDGR